MASLNCLGQEAVAPAQAPKPEPTTEIEYNYMTKGYRVQIESGLDMKSGYRFEDGGEFPIGDYSFRTMALMREVKNELAGILVVAKSRVSGNTYYVGIPIGNDSLMSKYLEVLSQWDAGILRAYSFYTSLTLVSAYSYGHELEKQVKK